MAHGQPLDLSIVIPVFNEEESLELLHTRVAAALDALPLNSEIILVDDGSKDNSFAIMSALVEKDARVRVVRLRRNFGQTAAFAAGFDLARGDVVITLDADLQNDPDDIPLLLAKLDEGYDVVSGWRVDRQDKLITRRIPSQAANRLISSLTDVQLHDYGCSLKAYRSEVVKSINLYGELHRFIPALASWMGVRVAEVPVRHSARQYGKSKYGISRTIRVFLDLLTVKFLLDYATRPIHVFGLMGLISLFTGTAIGLYLTIAKLFFGEQLADRPLLLLAILLIVMGVQLITMGLLAELVIRTYHESQGKPIYVIRDIVQAGGDVAEPAVSPTPDLVPV
ncbi:MAG: glycosyltransferase family 2 protein [Caldilineales bacterium]|nr:glycosyltransferase family 2 protein [Caldilineales bacterium]